MAPTEVPAEQFRAARLQPGRIFAWALALMALALGLLLCGLVLLVLVSLSGTFGSGPLGAAGARASLAAERAGQSVAAAGQSVRDALDPTHPPREALRQDTELDALQIAAVGGGLGESAQGRLELVAVAKRHDATDAASAQYAEVRFVDSAPRARQLWGIPLGHEPATRTHYLYKGQTYRLGSRYYRVNWVSFDQQQVAVGRYRSADGALDQPAFAYD